MDEYVDDKEYILDQMNFERNVKQLVPFFLRVAMPGDHSFSIHFFPFFTPIFISHPVPHGNNSLVTSP